MMDNQELVRGLIRQDRKVQAEMYREYAPRTLALIRRYLPDPQASEDVLVSVMFKAMTQASHLREAEQFPGWIRRIAVNECLMLIRKQNLGWKEDFPDSFRDPAPLPGEELQAKDLFALLDHLPPGARTVFNLYAIDGFKHVEIAKMLGISINTSKSQVIIARKKLKDLLVRLNYPGIQGWIHRPETEEDEET